MKLKHLLIGMLAFVAAVSCKEDQPVETPTLKVSETSLSFAAEGGEKSFNLTANLDWTATPDADWLSVEPTSGKGSDKATAIKVTADENTTTEARTATVKVKAGSLSETISVTQAKKEATEPEQPEQPEQPKAATIKDFVKEYVKIIDVWTNNVGVVNVVGGIGAKNDANDVQNAHYVPDDTKVVVGEVEYTLADAVELASRSYLLLRGYDGNDTKTYGRNLPIAKLEKAYTLDDALPATHSYTWGQYPYAERTNGGDFKMVTSEGEFELMKVDILDDYSHRHTNFPGQGGALSNFCAYTGGYLAGYDGCCCVKRIMMAYAHFFKYMLDNNLQDATGVSADQTFDAPLFGVPAEPEQPEQPAQGGTEANPYLIASAEDLAKIATLAKADAATYFKMTADVDMAAVEYVPTDSLAMVHFDGDNHTVANLKTPLFGTCVTCKNLTVTGSEVAPTFVSGLLAQVIGATDVPATLTNVKIQGKITAAGVNYLGGFAGKSVSDLNMTDCTADVTIESSGSSVAGLIGASQAVLNMTNCSVTGTVKGKGNIGGLVGNMSKGGNVVNCFNKSEVVATSNSVAGIAGNFTGGMIESSYNEGNISGAQNIGGLVGNATDVNVFKSHSKCNVTASSGQYGGIIGALKSADNATLVKVTECWFSGNVKCTANSNCGGGIVARAYTPAEVTKCWSEGTIEAYTNIGGIIGYSNCALTVKDCYSTMNLTANGGQSVGGVVGNPAPASGEALVIENCYATGTLNGKCGVGGVVGMIQIDAIPDNFGMTLKNCVYWGTSITATSTDPTNYTSGAILGNIRDSKKDHASKVVSNIVDNYRNPSMTFADYDGKFPDASNGPEELHNPLVDNDNCVGKGVLPPYLVPQDKGYKNDWAQMAYHGKAAAEGATVSSLAKAAGWDETIWDLSGDLPVFKK